MTKNDIAVLKECTVAAILKLADVKTLEELCTQSIAETIEQAKKDALKDIISLVDRAKESEKSCNRSEDRINNHVLEIRRELRTLDDAKYYKEQAVSEIDDALERFSVMKRQANEITNNAVIDGFECSTCGCIVKNICVNGTWVKRVRFCPNCGGRTLEDIRDAGEGSKWREVF